MTAKNRGFIGDNSVEIVMVGKRRLLHALETAGRAAQVVVLTIGLSADQLYDVFAST